MGTEPTRYSASYRLGDPGGLLDSLRNLREFRGVRSEAGVEELVWAPPGARGDHNGSRPVATLLVDGQRLRIETRSRQALHALQLLVEKVTHGGAVLVSSEPPGPNL